GYSERARVRSEARVVELVCPAGVVEEPGRDERNVDIPRLLDRLAVVEALRHREFAGALLHEAGDAEQVLSAISARELRPGAVVGAARGGDGDIHVPGVRSGDLGDLLLRRGRDARERGAVTLDEVAVDEEPIALLQVEDRLRLRRRGVFQKSHCVAPEW